MTADAHGPLHAEHRFLLIGQTTIFAYHLAFFHVPAHAYQLIMKIELDKAGRTKYLEEQAAPEHQQAFYSLKNTEHFAVEDIAYDRMRGFPAKLERVTVSETGQRTFTPLMDVSVSFDWSSVRYFRELTRPVLDYPQNVTYLLFGEGDETHLAHQLARPPHWDELRTVRHPRYIDQATLAQVPKVTFPTLRESGTALSTSPLHSGEAVTVRLAVQGGGAHRTAEFEIGPQRWWNHTSLNPATP